MLYKKNFFSLNLKHVDWQPQVIVDEQAHRDNR